MKAVNFSQRPSATVNLIGGRLCLDFVNTVGARRTRPSGEMVIRDEKLNDSIDLIAWAQHAGVCNDPETRGLVKQAVREPHEAAAVLRAALRLREALYQIFKSILLDRRADSLDLAIFNEALQAANNAREIAVIERAFEWRWKERVASLEKILWLVSESAADLLTKGDLSRLTQCGGDDCGWIFEDMTRNHSRHWCDTRDCGNRERVRRFRSRRAAEDD